MLSKQITTYLTSLILQVLLILFVPCLSMWINKRYRHISFLSPVVICFAVGILIRNLHLLPIDEKVCGIFRDGSILYALPLLLFSSDVKAWLQHSQTTLISFSFAVIAGIIAATLAAFFFNQEVIDVWIPAGMMVGIHTGGTPNLFAVGLALDAREEVLTLTNSAQIMWGAIYLLFLLSFAQKLIGKILGSFSQQHSEAETPQEDYVQYGTIRLKDVLIALLMTSLIVAVSVGLSYLIFDNLVSSFIVVFVTTVAIMFSFSQYIRTLNGPFEVGDYCLLMFGVAVGMMSDFRTLIAEGGPYIIFVGSIFIITILIHLTLSKLFKIDRDTFIISSTAAIYGPVFIPQVSQALKNRSLILGGIAVSLIGLAIGNYIGIGTGYFIRYLLSI